MKSEKEKEFEVTFFVKWVPGWSAILILMTMGLNTGCSSIEHKNIQMGDVVEIEYRCQLANGEIVSTSRKDEAMKVKSSFVNPLQPKENYGPFMVTAGKDNIKNDFGKLKTFEKEILNQIALQLPGKKTNADYTLKLSAKTPDGLTDQDRYIFLSKKRRVKKKYSVPMKEFLRGRDKKPLKGEVLVNEKDYQLTVTDIAGDHVELESVFAKGTVQDLAYGKGTVYDRGDYYEIDIDARPGHLLLTGPVTGRIVEAGEKTFKIDYGNPFGGEILICGISTGGSASHIETSGEDQNNNE
jgi:FKBP-type peptidyl-prolyl cis-trans isomerase 2